MERIKFNFEVLYTRDFNKLSSIEQNLVILARQASFDAYAPYSGFCVGAAVLLASGKIITGNNQENIAYPNGLCAERVAMFSANAAHPNDPIEAIAIASSGNKILHNKAVFPCGSCRQSLLESEMRFKNNIKVIMTGSEDFYIVESIKRLLPLNFDPYFQ